MGAGLSGIAASNLANYLGAQVILTDSNKNIMHGKISNNIKTYLGEHPEDKKYLRVN